MSEETYIAPTEPHEPISRKEWEATHEHRRWDDYRRAVKPLQKMAHNEVCKAIARGEIPRADTWPCVDCGMAAVEYDHRDYRKPLDVEPVCRRCNLRRGPALPYRLDQ